LRYRGIESSAVGNQSPNELETVQSSARDGAWQVESTIRTPRPSHLMQGRPTLSRRVWICSLVKKQRRKFVVSVIGGEHERAHAIGQALVNVCAGIEECSCSLQLSASHGEQQRCEHPRRRFCVDIGSSCR